MTCGPEDKRDRAMAARRRAPFVAATYPPEAPDLQVAVVQDRLKIVVDATGGLGVFDLETDPEETTDISDRLSTDPLMGALLATARSELAAAAEAESLDLAALSPEAKDRLRALGYLDGDE